MPEIISPSLFLVCKIDLFSQNLPQSQVLSASDTNPSFLSQRISQGMGGGWIRGSRGQENCRLHCLSPRLILAKSSQTQKVHSLKEGCSNIVNQIGSSWLCQRIWGNKSSFLWSCGLFSKVEIMSTFCRGRISTGIKVLLQTNGVDCWQNPVLNNGFCAVALVQRVIRETG